MGIMDDLIPFLVFIVIALINLVKFLLERKFQGRKPQEEGKEQEQRPSTLEDFFEDLAQKLDPNQRPADLPEWPEGYEKPDYAAEQAAYEDYQEQEQFEPVRAEPPPPPPTPVEVAQELKREAEVAEITTGSLKSALKSIPALRSSFASGAVPSIPVMKSSSAGRISFSLQDKSNLRKAILAKVVLDPPRAFDRTFENTSSR